MRTKNKLTPETALAVLQGVFDFREVPFDFKVAVADLVHRFANRSYDRSWTFMMMNMPRYAAIVRWLQEHSRQPMRAVMLWNVCVELADRYDGSIPLDRSSIAAELHVDLQAVSRMLGELVKTRALIRERGADGKYAYRLNRLVATNIENKKLREQLQLKEPEIVGVSGLWPHVPHLADEDEEITVSLRA